MSTQPPGNLSVENMPQFVMLTFDDAVNDQNMGLYRELLDPGRRRNRATGCNIAATFFVSAGYTDYSFVHELHSVGSEIALHSITHRDNRTYWRTLDVEGWEDEFVGVRRLLRDYALIPEEDMVGARAPFIEIGGGDSHVMMQKNGILFDSSISVSYRQGPSKLPIYPYTLDYGLQTECEIKSCPGGVYKGLWTVPLNRFYRTAPYDDGSHVHSSCPLADGCCPNPITADDMFDYLRTNFESYYHHNRAPFPLFIHENWLWIPERRQGYLAFVDWLLTKDDVFLVTVAEVVQFMRNPKPLGEYAQSKCSKASEFSRCPEIHTCGYAGALIKENRYLIGCKPCPKTHPWLRSRAQEEAVDKLVVAVMVKKSIWDWREEYTFILGCVIVFALYFRSGPFVKWFCDWRREKVS